MHASIALVLLQAALPRDGLSVATDVAVIIGAVAVLAVAAVAIRLFLIVGRAVRELQAGARQNLGPVSDRARSISDNVEFITQALRTDVERLNASVKALTERLQLASERMEERIEEFNALMEVVQTEAEDLFLDTASAVRGVRAGARSIGSATRPGGSEPPVPDLERESEDDEVDAPHLPRAVATEDA